MPSRRPSMRNLRKRYSEPIYNDDKVYEQLEKRKQNHNGNMTKVNGVNGVKEEVQYTKIPEYVYADDGRKFYPCLYCCHAFAFKEMKLIHMQQCTFRTSSEVSQYVKVVPKKLQAKKMPRVVHKKVKAVMKSKIRLKIKKHVPFPVVIKTEPGSTIIPEVKKKKPKVKAKPRYKTEQMPVQTHRTEKHIYPRIKISEEAMKKYDEMYKKSDMTKCTICGRPIKRLRWPRHLNTHLVQRKKYGCTVCGKEFARKDNRNAHVKRNTCTAVGP